MKKLVMLISACTLLSITSCSKKEEVKNEVAQYTVTNPVMKDTTFTKDYVAQIQSLQNVEIRAQEKGYLETLHVDEGANVKSGQVLFNITPKLYEADFLKAKADAKIAILELQNTKALADKNIVSKTELAMSQAKLDEANAELAMAETHLSFTTIHAPFDGTIDRIRFKKGSLIDEGIVLTTISNNKEIYAYFNMSETEYLDYKTRATNDNNNKVSLMLSNGTMHKYKGTIETVESEFDNTTGNIAFRAKFPNPEYLLKHGETGKIQMVVPLKKALIIPQKATFEIQDKIYVYVVNQKNIVQSRNILIQQKLPNIYVVKSGLTANEKILIDGIQTVKEGDKIEAKNVSANKVLQSLQLIKQ